jgi:hypothetical protein
MHGIGAIDSATTAVVYGFDEIEIQSHEPTISVPGEAPWRGVAAN